MRTMMYGLHTFAPFGQRKAQTLMKYDICDILHSEYAYQIHILTFYISSSEKAPLGFSQFPTKWKLTIVLPSLLCAILLIILVVLAARPGKKTSTEEPVCQSAFKQNIQIDNASPNLFQDLTASELRAVNDYLQSQATLNLTTYSKATLLDNFIYAIELYLPDKATALKYLDGGGPKPQRQARAIIFHGSDKAPYVQEYLVQYLPRPSKHVKLQLKSRKTTIPYYGRPFTFKDARESYDLIRGMTEEAYPLMKESFGSWFHNCTNHCLSWFAIGEPSRNEANKRYSWVGLNNIFYHTKQ